MKLLEFSPVFTSVSVNFMSEECKHAMKDLHDIFTECYNGDAFAIIPGAGTHGMEAVARQFLSNDTKCVIVRNGYFSYRWTQIIDHGKLTSEATVIKARQASDEPKAPWRPAPIEEIVNTIKEVKPKIVFAPHVETSTGILLKDSELKAIGEACNEVGALFALDCIASGTLWVDMKELNIDILISAPQKGWTSMACLGLVVMNEKAANLVRETSGTCFALDLNKWLALMDKYVSGQAAYHTTIPTDGIVALRDAARRVETFGWEKSKKIAIELGATIRAAMEAKGLKSVAADEWKSPTVLVHHTPDSIPSPGDVAAAFKKHGMQIAGGVPFMLGEENVIPTFRVGLFGLDKLSETELVKSLLQGAFDDIF